MSAINNPKRVAIINLGIGNLFSVIQACQKVGIEPFLATSKEDILKADGIILPGVGAFKVAMNKLREENLVNVIQSYKKPILGICLGMQLFFDSSDEGQGSKGLGLISGVVKQFPNTAIDTGEKLRVPHVGWTDLSYNPLVNKEKSLLKSLGMGDLLYFVHSYYISCEEDEAILSYSEYGGIKICSSIQKNNILGCQFHPEKSGELGVSIYSEFKNILNRS